jgi:AraC family transcriptional regulator
MYGQAGTAIVTIGWGVMSRNSSMEKIGRVVDYIEENIKERLTLDEISDHVRLSKYYLNRIFRAITERQLMDYVRARKLSSSVRDLLDTNLKIIDISFEYGFGYEQSYIRSFKRAFGISPDLFRRTGSAVTITDPISLSSINPVGDDGMIMEPVIRIKPGFTIVGMTREITGRESLELDLPNKLGNDFFFTRRKLVSNAVNPEVYIGHVGYLGAGRERSRYTPSVEVSPGGEIPEGMSLIAVPTNKYAVFTYIGNHHPRFTAISRYYSMYRYIFDEWLPKSPYSLADRYHFERIDNTIGRDDYCELELFIPISSPS